MYYTWYMITYNVRLYVLHVVIYDIYDYMWVYIIPIMTYRMYNNNNTKEEGTNGAILE